MKLIVGLGNPGIEYQFSPHNIGFLAIDRIADQQQVKIGNRHCRALTGRTEIGNVPALLAKPETFMNLSGLAVRELVEKYEALPSRDLIVVYDELDFPLGTLRVRERGGSAGHNGIESIIGALGTEEFIRVRLGVDPGHSVADGAKYLLAPMKKKDLEAVDLLLDKAAEAVRSILTDGVSAAMNRFNRREPAEAGTAEAQ